MPRQRRKSTVEAGDDHNDDDNDDESGDDFDEFEEGGEGDDDDFGDFDDGFQQAEADTPAPVSTTQPQAPIPSFVRLGPSLDRIYYTNTNTNSTLSTANIRSRWP